jgi:hypothetical protein
MKNENKIQELKQELLDKYNIATDRDLIRQLNIKEEDKGKLFAWIKYQRAYEYRDGWNEGREELKEQLAELLSERQANVSGNEANPPSENKKDGKVAVCEICAGYDDGWDDSITCTKCNRWLTL